MDFQNSKMIYLDSSKNNGEQAANMKKMKWPGYFMEAILDDCRFFRSHDTPKLKCSDFGILMPEVPQQEEGSNNCGVWVAQWQLMSYVWEDYLVEVNMQTLMRLALDLVIGPHNPKSKEVEELAIKV
ncbi:hypothetical protein PIB30_042737 [Stylosanthes scabra]|uniref:Ubiquitin-like protease family profile domain-containing protein n=1 Tax=Stylosanthes scabra TaxID=79078 RepID=A0ABU6RFD6_9FABA|nr:hypothetical protein [Stylosanthes scabra]